MAKYGGDAQKPGSRPIRLGNLALSRITRLQTEALIGRPGLSIGISCILPREALWLA